MRTLRPVSLLCLAAILSGCFQTKTLIRLNEDGSGTVEETVLMNSTMAMSVMMGAADLFSMTSESAEAPEADEIPEGPYTMEQLEARAAAMGATLQGVQPIDITFGSGYTATFAFSDINMLRFSGNPMSEMGGMLSEMGASGAPEEEDEPITFAFSQGQLTVRMPEPMDVEDPKKNTDDTRGDTDMGEGPDPAEVRQMALMLKDMEFSLAIELPSAVRETNASHASGQMVTLFDMDLGLLAENPEILDQLDDMGLDGPPDFSMGGAAMFQSVPGFTFETEREVTVSF